MAKVKEFDDASLQRLAKNAWYGSKFNAVDLPIEDLLRKPNLSNEERNQLLAFLESARPEKPPSMIAMKRDIFRLIGITEFENSQNGVSRSEMLSIWNFIRSKHDQA